MTLSMITDFLFVNYLTLINERFFKLNQLLRVLVRQNFRLSSFEVAVLYVIERDSFRKQNNRAISNVDTLRLLHHNLCCISKKV